ncbi:MAG TPA: 1,2-phenylacetyl-CoA epoxidase subunit PaaD [Nitriliruptorales bacterium]
MRTISQEVDEQAVRAAAEAVPDPELPPVTLGMLGVLQTVEVGDDGAVRIDLLPTFAGCPATEMMERDVAAAVGAVEGVRDVTVRFVYDPPWSTDRITDDGRAALAEFGIAPPGAWANAVADLPAGRRLPVAPATSAAVACPYCGSTQTTEDSPFGPTPCRAVHHCASCRQPFEAFKPL